MGREIEQEEGEEGEEVGGVYPSLQLHQRVESKMVRSDRSRQFTGFEPLCTRHKAISTDR